MASTGSSPIGISLSIGAVLLTVGIVLSHFIIDYNFRKPKVPLIARPLYLPAAVWSELCNRAQWPAVSAHQPKHSLFFRQTHP
jgi:hypothetical protein